MRRSCSRPLRQPIRTARERPTCSPRSRPEDEWRIKRKDRSRRSQTAALEEEWKALEREARESLAKGEAIEDAVYDLKAVNPNRVNVEDKRTPPQLLDFITTKGLEADAALARLRKLVAKREGSNEAPC